MISGILMGAFVLLMLIDVPIAFALLGGSMIAMLASDKNLMPAAQSMIATVDSFSLLAIPLFIAAGDLMNRGGISAAPWRKPVLWPRCFSEVSPVPQSPTQRLLGPP
jgi:TRAP-type mannitol/chloroaromatic compound transport system permease large subunit